MEVQTTLNNQQLDNSKIQGPESESTLHENLWKSMKSMNMYGIHLFRTQEIGCILYSKNMNASHFSPPRRNKLFKQRHGNQGFLENMDFDM